jgi:chromosomal replication initiation ATPase DnaA
MNQIIKTKLNNAKSDGERISLIIKYLAIARVGGRSILKEHQFDQVGQIFENWKNEGAKPSPGNEGLETILQAVKDVTGIDLKTDLSNRRATSTAKFIYCYFARQRGHELRSIGYPIKRDHSTVVNAIIKTQQYKKTDPEFRRVFEAINKKLQQSVENSTFPLSE